MIYLYCVSPALAVPPAVRGLDDAPLELVGAGTLSGVCSRHEHLDLRTDPESCLAHERVVEAVMRTATVLPARLGTTFEDDGALITALTDAADSLSRRLTRVAGCVELAVRWRAGVTAKQDPVSDGRAYLEAKLETERRSKAIVDQMLGELHGLAVEAQPIPVKAPRSLSFLVQSGEVERFRAAVTQLQRQHPRLSLSCTGPWAPYSFSAEEAA